MNGGARATTKRPWPLRYAAAVFAVAIATLVREGSIPLLAGSHSIGPYITFYPAVLFAAWYGGLGAGALATFVSALAADYFFVVPDRSLMATSPGDMVSLVMFAGICLGIASVIDSQRRAMERADRVENELRLRAEVLSKAVRERRVFAALIENSSDFIGIADVNGKPIYVNPAGRHMVGMAIDHPIENTQIPEYYPADQRSFATDVIVRSMIEKGHWQGETYFRNWQTEESIPVSDTHFMIRDPETGESLGMGTVTRDITERKQSEEALLQSRDQLRAALKFSEAVKANIQEGLYTLDSKGLVTYVNPTAERLFGWKSDELIGRKMHDVTHYKHRDGTPFPAEECAVLLVLVAGRTLAEHADVFIRKDGSFFDVLYGSAPLFSDTGEVEGLVVVFRDVTKRKEIEERFHLAVEAAPNGMVMSDETGKILLVNSYAEKLFGYTRDEMIGQPIEMLVPERFRASHGRYRQNFSGNPETRPMGAGRDLYGLRKDGSEFPIEIGLNPITTDQGSFVLSGIVDITERQRADAVGRLLASIVESSAEGIITEDLNGVVTSWNPGAEHMFGYSSEEMIGRPISVIILSSQGNEIPGVLESVKRGEAIEQYETVRRTKSGKLLNVSITWSPLHDGGGRIVGASKVIRDITQRRQVEEQRMELLAKERALAAERTLRETEAELARVVRALSVGELATSIAHEVNQPLAGVVTNAEAGLRWLSGETPNIEEAKESLALIVRDGNRASAVIRRIREFLKKERQEIVSLNTIEVVEEVIALVRTELTKRHVNLRTELSSELPRVRGDRIQLQQVLLNLIMNGADAVAATNASKELAVTCQATTDGGVVVSVRDSGVGIDPQDMNRMFDAFFTTKPSGMGMGLSLSRSIIEAHGGKIWAQPNEGRGLTVHFSLPTERADQKSGAAAGEAR